MASAVSPPAQLWLSSGDKIGAGGAGTRRGPGGVLGGGTAQSPTVAQIEYDLIFFLKLEGGSQDWGRRMRNKRLGAWVGGGAR